MQKFNLEMEDYAELFHPLRGDPILLIHFMGLFPCTFWSSASRVLENLVEHSYDFLDLNFKSEDFLKPKHELMWRIDALLRAEYKSERIILKKVDDALNLAYKTDDKGNHTPKSDTRNYLGIFELASPVYRLLRHQNRFDFEDFFWN